MIIHFGKEFYLFGLYFAAISVLFVSQSRVLAKPFSDFTNSSYIKNETTSALTTNQNVNSTTNSTNHSKENGNATTSTNTNNTLQLEVSNNTNLNISQKILQNVSRSKEDVSTDNSVKTTESENFDRFQNSSSARNDIIKGKNHASFSTFNGNINKFEFGTIGDSDKLNGSRSVTTLNETRGFDMGNTSYVLTNLTSTHNCSGCMRDKSEGKESLESYTGAAETRNDSVDDGSASGDGQDIISKKCKTKKLTIESKQRDLFDMFSREDDDDVAASNINCVTATRRRLVTNHRTHRKTTHSNGTSTEKNDKSTQVEKDDKNEEEKNKERQKTNNERAKSNEDRAKELEKTKYKILHGIHDEPQPAEVTQDDRYIDNKTMTPDPSMIPNNETEKEPDADHLDAGVGIVGMDTHPPIEKKNKTAIKQDKTEKNKLSKVNTADKNSTVTTDKTNMNSTANKTEQHHQQPAKKRVLCFGDSLTSGFYGNNKTRNPYSNQLEKLLEDDKNVQYEVLTDGVNGECASKEMQKRIPEVLKEGSPLDLVVILAGTNDLLTENCGKDVDLYEEITKLHEIVHKGGIKSVVVTIPEIAISVNGTKHMSRDEFKEAWNEVNQKLRLYVSTYKNPDQVILSDLADELTRQGAKGGNSMEGFWADNIHPTEKGYDRIGEIIYKDIKGKF